MSAAERAGAPAAPPSLAEVPAEAWLEANLAALDLPWATRREVARAVPRGRVVVSADGTPVLEVDGQVLGAALDEDLLHAIVEQSRTDAAYVVFGLGTGHVARALRAATDRPVLVYEPDAGLLRTVLSAGPTDLGEIPLLTSLQDLTATWVRVGTRHLEGVIVKTPGYEALFPEQLLALPQAVHDTFERIGITHNTFHLRARTWVEDIMANLPELPGRVPFTALAGRFRAVPAFIVGAGPSLDRNVELLGEARRRGLVFAVNSSARALARKGLEPHVLACIESIDSSTLLAELPYIDRVVRAVTLSAAPGNFRAGAGLLLPIHESLPQLDAPLEALLGSRGVAVCGSVSTAAFSLALTLGCSPIVFVGQDLAYTSGRTHAGGTWWETSRAKVDEANGKVHFEWSESLRRIGHRHVAEPLQEVPAWGGTGTVPSGASFTGIRTWLEGASALIAATSPGTRLINATEGGARLGGFEEMRLGDLLAELPLLDLETAELSRRAEGLPPLDAGRVAAWASDQADRATAVAHAARRLRRHAAHAVK
ncbi:MAG: DUF115 domain-containing protein, partial [Deltaproteobacteria bacterium]|nr:DUF115 domain-containing protein [Deltaproteobacteria bacterium]